MPLIELNRTVIVGFHTHGGRWPLRPSRTRYFNGAMSWWRCWRAFVIFDRR